MVWSEVRRYGAAVGLVAAAVLFARALHPYITPHVSPPYFLAIMLAAAFAGAGPGLLATLLSSLAIAFFDLGTTHSLHLGVGDLVRLAVFVLTALIISSISAARKTAERKLQLALEELSALDRSKDEFIATVSHELRTPLTGIIGWLRILRVEDLDPETRALALDSIEQSTNTQAMLVNDMLDTSRIVLGKLHLDRQPFLVGDAVRDAMAVIHPEANAKKIRMLTSGLDDSIVVSGDRERLKQVVWNLLANAVKFMPEGRAVHVNVMHDERDAIIEVTDEGEGIDVDLLGYVFDRFRQGPGGVNRGGLGLGLSIARHIVELHGGSISAFSAGRDRGAVFTVRLPLLRDAQRRRPAPAREPDTGPDGEAASVARQP